MSVQPAQISVIIPVYNAAPFVRQAVESALAQPETGEVILIEDGSSDDSLGICRELEAEHERVRMLQHPGGVNRGVSASRNLGIQASCLDLLAFLDADDLYLTDRFKVSASILAAQPEVDGVYEAMDLFFETPEVRKRWQEFRKLPDGLFAQMPTDIPPEKLFEHLAGRKRGHFHLNAFTIRRQVFDSAGLFNEHLKASEDTTLLHKIAACSRLVPGEMRKAVATLRVHGMNSFSGVPRSPWEIQKWRIMGWQEVWFWGRDRLTRPQKNALLSGFVRYITAGISAPGLRGRLSSAIRTRVQLTRLLFSSPHLALYWRFWVCYLPSLQFISYRLGLLSKLIRSRRSNH